MTIICMGFDGCWPSGLAGVNLEKSLRAKKHIDSRVKVAGVHGGYFYLRKYI